MREFQKNTFCLEWTFEMDRQAKSSGIISQAKQKFPLNAADGTE